MQRVFLVSEIMANVAMFCALAIVIITFHTCDSQELYHGQLCPKPCSHGLAFAVKNVKLIQLKFSALPARTHV